MRADLMIYSSDGKDVIATDVAAGYTGTIGTMITPNLAKLIAEMMNSLAEHNRRRNWEWPEFDDKDHHHGNESR